LHAAEQQHGDLELNSVGNGGPAAGLRKMRGGIKVWRPGSMVAPHELTRVRSHGSGSARRACVPDHGGGGRARYARTHGGGRAVTRMARLRGELARGELATGRGRRRAHRVQSQADMRLRATMHAVSWSGAYLRFRSISHCLHVAAIQDDPHSRALRMVCTKIFSLTLCHLPPRPMACNLCGSHLLFLCLHPWRVASRLNFLFIYFGRVLSDFFTRSLH
jgi:hypothetical protein